MAKITIEFDTNNEQDMVNYKKAMLAPAMYLALAELKYHTFSDEPEMQERVESVLTDFKIEMDDLYDDPLLT
jgi:hypothetical protein